MANRIDLNHASIGQLCELPGVSKTLAYRIVNHRKRHGQLTDWNELAEIRHFPIARLDEIKGRAVLRADEPNREGSQARRSGRPQHVQAVRKRPAGYSRRLRSGRRKEKIHNAIRDRAA